jgi:hypothetical protein
MKLQFEFVHYGPDASGEPSGVREYRRYQSAEYAKTYAGRLCKRIDGPVDVAYAGAAEWNDRYLTTASPSSFHANGYRFERLT